MSKTFEEYINQCEMSKIICHSCEKELEGYGRISDDELILCDICTNQDYEENK